MTIQQAWNELQATRSYVERFKEHATVETDAAPAAHLCQECLVWEPDAAGQDADDDPYIPLDIEYADAAWNRENPVDHDELDEMFAPSFLDTLDPQDIYPR